MLVRASTLRASVCIRNTKTATTTRTRTRPKLTIAHHQQRLYTTTRPRLLAMAAAPPTAQATAVSEGAEGADTNTSGVTAASISASLKAKLDASHVEIQDMSGGCGQAFSALIVSPQFASKSLLARHRLVNGALKAEIAAIHAWTPRCLTPEQWDKEKEREREGER